MAGTTWLELLQDTATPTPSGQYIGLRFSSATPLTNVYARATVGGGGFALDATETADHFIGSLEGTAKTSYWYINQPPTGNGTFQVRLYLGDPAAGGTLQATSPLYTLRSNDGDQAAAANKVTSITVNGGNPIQLGQSFNVVVQYLVNSAGPNLLVQPAALATFDPYNLRLGATRVQLCSDTACGSVINTLNNQLYFAAVGGGVNGMRATYTFQTVGAVSVNVSPVVVARSGQYKYNADSSATTVSPTVPAPVNRVRIAKSVDLAQSSVGTTVTYTLTALNSGAVAVNLDDFADTLPSSPAAASYIAGSSKLNGVAFANPLASGQVLTWRDPGGQFTVPAGGSLALSFQAALPGTSGVYTNSAVGHISANVIGSTEALNSPPATATTRIGSPDLTLMKADAGGFTVGGTGSYTFTVTNAGFAASSGTVSVTDTLPPGLTVNGGAAGPVPAGGADGANWSCSAGAVSPQTVTCTSTASIGSGDSSLFSLGVAVGLNAAVGPNSVTNTATVAGGGETNTGNNGASDATTVLSPDLTVTKGHSPSTFVRGGTGSYTLTVTNGGTAPTSGTVSVTDTLPAGLNVNGGASGPVAVGGADGVAWACSADGASPQTVICSSSTALAVSGNSAFSLNVTVAGDAAPSLMNTVAVSGGNEATLKGNNNGASDEVVTTAPSDLTLAKTATGTFYRGGTGSYTLTVTNVGVAATSGPVTVTDALPTGLGYSGFGGAGWTCSASGQAVTCETAATLLPGGASAVTLAVDVATNAPSSLENTATVSGGGELNVGNNSGSVTTGAVDAGRIVLSKSVRNVSTGGAFGVSSEGSPGDVLEYCVVYENVGESGVTSTVMHDPVPTYTAARTAVGDYADQAIRWRVTSPAAIFSDLSADADADPGEIGTALTVRLGDVPPAGAGEVCFQVTIE